MESYKEDDLKKIIERGWVMFDVKNRPKKESEINLFSPTLKKYYNPGSGWTRKAVNDGKAIIFRDGGNNLIRKAILFDDTGRLACYVYFFSSYLTDGIEEWKMVGLYVDDMNIGIKVKGLNYCWYKIGEDQSIMVATMEKVMKRFVDEGGVEKPITSNPYPIELISNNPNSFNSFGREGSLMMLTALKPYWHDTGINTAEDCYEALNETIGNTVISYNVHVVNRLMWVMHTYQSLDKPWMVNAINSFFKKKCFRIIDDLAMSAGKMPIIESDESLKDIMAQTYPIMLLRNHAEHLRLNDFMRLALVWMNNQHDSDLINLICRLNTLKATDISDEIIQLYDMWNDGHSFKEIERAMFKSKKTTSA